MCLQFYLFAKKLHFSPNINILNPEWEQPASRRQSKDLTFSLSRKYGEQHNCWSHIIYFNWRPPSSQRSIYNIAIFCIRLNNWFCNIPDGPIHLKWRHLLACGISSSQGIDINFERKIIKWLESRHLGTAGLCSRLGVITTADPSANHRPLFCVVTNHSRAKPWLTRHNIQ